MKHYLLFILLFCSFITYSQNYRANEVIVRLNFKLLDWEVVDDKEVNNSRIKDLLNDEGISYLEQLPQASFNFESLIAQKLFPGLTTADSISIGRQGQEVSVPPFWATFKIDVPDNLPVADSLKVLRFCEDLEDLYPLVIYAHPNFLVETTDANDPEFDNQLAMHPTNGQIDHINIDSAWTITSGKPWIKVGIFDTGIDSTHEDIELLTGWNYLDPSAFQWGTCYVNDHGHRVAGIIGAKRNNDLGIAGIAGGNNIDQVSADSTGVSLIDFKRYQDPNTVGSIDEVATGIVDAARYTGTYYDWSALTANNWYYAQNAPGYGIHIGNHSYSYTLDEGGKQETIDGVGAAGPGSYEGCELCRESFLFSLQNGVVNVVARGNRPNVAMFSTTHEGPQGLYPARYDDSWVISVSSSGTDGNRLIGGVNGTDDYFGYYGGDVDLIAPGSQDIVHTTHSQQDPNSTQDYGAFNGTSSAAPHVAGVSALLLSYYNKNCYSNTNLDPADVEYILEKSATWTQENIASGGYDEGSGHGRLNAYEALKMIELPKYQIVHPDSLAFNQQLIEQDTIDLRLGSPLSLLALGGPIGSQFPLEHDRDYRVVRHKYQLQYDFGQYIQPSTTLLDAWVRHSHTNSLRAHIDTTWTTDTLTSTGGVTYYEDRLIIDTFGVEPMCQIDSIINDSIITLSGYYYEFIEQYDEFLDFMGTPAFVPSTPQTPSFWYPINPNVDTLKMAFSIYIKDDSLSSQYDFPCYAFNNLIDSFANVYETNPLSFELFPNPGTNQLSIRLPEQSKGNIYLHDVSGRLVHQIRRTQNTLYFIDTKDLNRGVYFVTYESEGVKSSQKWIKQ